jgi:hypothetical protein
MKSIALVINMDISYLKYDFIKEFEPDDEKYLQWLKSHREGFILTSNKSLYPDFTVIHRATCNKIKIPTGTAKPGGFTERNYIKVYANTTIVLENWLLKKKANGKSRKCTICI